MRITNTMAFEKTTDPLMLGSRTLAQSYDFDGTILAAGYIEATRSPMSAGTLDRKSLARREKKRNLNWPLLKPGFAKMCSKRV